MTIDEELDWLCRLRSYVQYADMPKEWRPAFTEVLSSAIKTLEKLQEVNVIGGR